MILNKTTIIITPYKCSRNDTRKYILVSESDVINGCRSVSLKYKIENENCWQKLHVIYAHGNPHGKSMYKPKIPILYDSYQLAKDMLEFMTRNNIEHSNFFRLKNVQIMTIDQYLDQEHLFISRLKGILTREFIFTKK